MAKRYEMYEDNAGGLHLAILDEAGACVYYLTDRDADLVRATLDEFKAGGDPIADGWDGGEEDPQACYSEIRAFVEARNGGAWEIDA